MLSERIWNLDAKVVAGVVWGVSALIVRCGGLGKQPLLLQLTSCSLSLFLLPAVATTKGKAMAPPLLGRGDLAILRLAVLFDASFGLGLDHWRCERPGAVAGVWRTKSGVRGLLTETTQMSDGILRPRRALRARGRCVRTVPGKTGTGSAARVLIRRQIMRAIVFRLHSLRRGEAFRLLVVLVGGHTRVSCPLRNLASGGSLRDISSCHMRRRITARCAVHSHARWQRNWSSVWIRIRGMILLFLCPVNRETGAGWPRGHGGKLDREASCPSNLLLWLADLTVWDPNLYNVTCKFLSLRFANRPFASCKWDYFPKLVLFTISKLLFQIQMFLFFIFEL